MKISRTYPQPDSAMPNIGARERALAIYKYLRGDEPEAAIKDTHFNYVRDLFSQYELTSKDRAGLAFAAVLDQTCDVAQEHDYFACVQHAFEQFDRGQQGLHLEPSIVEQLRS